MQKHNKQINEWVNIRISPNTKFTLMKLKGMMKLNTYDQVINILINLKEEQHEEKQHN